MNSIPISRPAVNGSREPLQPVSVVGRLVTGTGTQLHDLFHGHAILEIEDDGGRLESYWCTLNISPDSRIAGLRLQRFACGNVYDLPADLDDCSCPDHTFRPERPGGCRHMAALRQALLAVAREIGPRQPSRRVERDDVTSADFTVANATER